MSTIIKTPSTPTRPTAEPPVIGNGTVSAVATAVLRLGLAWTFLWPFLDKTFGLGYSTSSKAAWIHGGSPTRGFLSHVSTGPLQSFFHSISGNLFIDWLFMLTLLGVGVALALGVVLRFAAVCGSFVLLMMWIAKWPMARFDAKGVATASTNPFLNYDLFYILGLFVVAAAATVPLWGLGSWWRAKTNVIAHPFLR